MNPARGITPKTAALRAAICTLLDASPDGVSVAELTHAFTMGVSGMEKHLTALHAEGRAAWAQVSTTRRWATPQHHAHVVAIGQAAKDATLKERTQRRKVRDALRERSLPLPPVVVAPKPERIKPLRPRPKRARVWSDVNAFVDPPDYVPPSIFHLAAYIEKHIGQEATT